jgi:hypothetical protein
MFAAQQGMLELQLTIFVSSNEDFIIIIIIQINVFYKKVFSSIFPFNYNN